jgi:hypothetical protein
MYLPLLSKIRNEDLKPYYFFIIYINGSFCFQQFGILISSTAFTLFQLLSITIGLTTFLSIIGASSFSKELYKLEDSTNNSKTLLMC